jgi:cell wall-associated NlpC family hydrolase
MTIRQRLATFTLACSVLSVGVLSLEAGSAGAAPIPAIVIAATGDSISTSAAAALASMGTNAYPANLESVAYTVAAKLGVDGARMHAAWRAADSFHQIALLSALTQVGVPYHRNASKIGIGFDCSGLTAFAWGQTGVELARKSGTQLRNAAKRTIDTAQAGDLVYYPGHVMLWLGVDNLIVHAPQRGKDVEVGHITARRVRTAKFGNPIG